MFFSIWTESAFVNRRRFKGFLPGRSASQSQSASQRRGNASEMNEFDVSVSLYIYMHFFPLDILSLSLQTVKYFCLTSFLLVVSSLFFGSIFKFLFGLIISSLYSCVLFVYLLFIFFRRIFLLLKKKIDGGRLLSEAESKRRRGSTQTTQVPLLFDFFFKYSNDQFDDQINK